MKKATPIFALMVALSAFVNQAACVSIPEEGIQPVLGTRVEDWRDEVIYQVLVDRFANGSVNNDFQVRPGALARYQGGDWRGMIEHLDYIETLGVTTLWISPVVKNVETDADVDGYHGYWAQDVTQTNPHFGDLADLRALVAEAHKRKLKVVLDIVTNHMGQAFFYDMNLNGKADIYIGGTGTTSKVERISEFDPDWDPRGVQAFTSLGNAGRAPIVFIQDPSINRVTPQPGILGRLEGYHGFGRILNYDDDKQRLLGDFPGGLKDVNTENPEVRDAMVDAYAKWVELTDLDGFRIDTVKHVEYEFWEDFAPRVRKRLAEKGKKNFLMFGEAFDGNDKLLGSYTLPKRLDSVFYFSQHFQVFRDVYQYASSPDQKGTKQIADLWAERPKNYGTEPQEGGIGIPPTKALVNFIDNHDVARFLFFARGTDTEKREALRNALTLEMTEDGIPCLYYGTEQDFAGGNDPANREVLWNTGFATTGETFLHFAKVARIRKSYVALRRGDQKVLFSTTSTGNEPDAGMFAFERTGGDAGNAYALVVANTNAKKESVTEAGGKAMETSLAAGTTLVDVLDPAQPTFTVAADKTLKVSVPAQRTRILIPQEQLVR
jgi:alpha-amylase